MFGRHRLVLHIHVIPVRVAEASLILKPCVQFGVVVGVLRRRAIHIGLDSLYLPGTERSVATRVDVGIVHHVGKRQTVYGVRNIHRLIDSHITRILHLGHCALAGRATLCCNQNDAERRTRTIDGCGCGILQYRHILDVGRVQCAQVAFHAVDQDERRRIGTIAQITHTTNVDIHGRTRSTTGIVGDVQTGNGTLQRLHGIHRRTVFHHLVANGLDGSRGIDFLLCSKTHDHDIVEPHC